MSSEDSFMQIVRERLGEKGFYESLNKKGLFYRKNQLLGNTIYLDLRNTPMRIYGYENETNKQMSQEIIDLETKQIKRMLQSIGCEPVESYEESKEE